MLCPPPAPTLFPYTTLFRSSGERTEFLRNIHSSGQHLLGLINDILDLAKIEAGKMELHAEEMPVAQALQEVTSILEPMARQQGRSEEHTSELQSPCKLVCRL